MPNSSEETFASRMALQVLTGCVFRSGRGLSVIDYAPKSPGAQAYQALITEIVDNGRTKGTRPAARKPVATDNADAA
jgi:hypothetical protein